MKKNKIISLSALLLFIGGLCAILYPGYSNWLNEKNASKVICEYENALNTLNEKDYTDMLNKAKKHNLKIQKAGSLAAAFHMEKMDELEEYNNLLNAGDDGIMCVLRIPAIHVKIPVYHTTKEEVIQKAAGHFTGSSLPVGGRGTHSVITGHRGLSSAELFTELDLLRPGDYFYIDVLDQTLAYQVDQIETVLPKDTDLLEIEPEKDLVTLVTCTPYGVNSHRMLVRGSRVSYEPEVAKRDREKMK